MSNEYENLNYEFGKVPFFQGPPQVHSNARWDRWSSIIFSPCGKFMAYGYYYKPPYYAVYRKRGDAFTQIQGLPQFGANNASYTAGVLSFSPNGKFFLAPFAFNSSFTTSTSFLFRIEGDNLVQIDSSFLPSRVMGGVFSPCGKKLVIIRQVAPYIKIYKIEGDIFTEMPFSGTALPSQPYKIDISPDGKFIGISLSGASSFYIYKVEDYDLIKVTTPSLATYAAQAVVFSPTGKYFAVGTSTETSGRLNIFKISGDNFTLLPNIPSHTPNHPYWTLNLTFSPDEKRLFVGSGSNPGKSMQYYDIDNKNDKFTKRGSIAGLGNYNYAAGITNDGETLILADAGYKSYKITDDNTFTSIGNPLGGYPPNNSYLPLFSSDGKTLSMGSIAAPFFLRYQVEGTQLTRLPNLPNHPSDIGIGQAWSPNEKYLFIGSQESNAKVYKKEGESFTSLSISPPTGVTEAIGFSPDGKFVAVSSRESPKVFIYSTGEVFNRVQETTLSEGVLVRGLTYTPDGNYLICAAEGPSSTRLQIYSVNSSGIITFYAARQYANEAEKGWGYKIPFLSDGKSFFISNRYSKKISYFETDNGNFTEVPLSVSEPSGEVQSLAVSPNNELLVASHNDSPFITIYRIEGTTLTKLPNPSSLPTGNGRGAAFSPDGSLLAVTHLGSPFLTLYEVRKEHNKYSFIKCDSDSPSASNYSVATINGKPSVIRQTSPLTTSSYENLGVKNLNDLFYGQRYFVSEIQKTGDMFQEEITLKGTSSWVGIHPSTISDRFLIQVNGEIKTWNGSSWETLPITPTQSTIAANGFAGNQTIPLPADTFTVFGISTDNQKFIQFEGPLMWPIKDSCPNPKLSTIINNGSTLSDKTQVEYIDVNTKIRFAVKINSIFQAYKQGQWRPATSISNSMTIEELEGVPESAWAQLSSSINEKEFDILVYMESYSTEPILRKITVEYVPNEAPKILSAALEPDEIHNDYVTLSAHVKDIEGDKIYYRIKINRNNGDPVMLEPAEGWYECSGSEVNINKSYNHPFFQMSKNGNELTLEVKDERGATTSWSGSVIVKNEDPYLVNGTVTYSSGKLTVAVSDPDEDKVSCRIEILQNGTYAELIKSPYKQSSLNNPAIFSYDLNSYQLLYDEDNVLRLIMTDEHGKSVTEEFTLKGIPRDLVFKDKENELLSDDYDNIVKKLTMDDVVGGKTTPTERVTIENLSGYALMNLVVKSDTTQFGGGEFEISKTEMPFEPNNELEYPGIFGDQEKKDVFIRVRTEREGGMGGEFKVEAWADIYDESKMNQEGEG